LEIFSFSAAKVGISSEIAKKFGGYFQKAVPLQRKNKDNRMLNLKQ
jgi:hypothetical protein